MADFVIKPTTGNLKIQDDQDVDRIVIAPTTGVTTLSNPTLTAPTIANMANCTFPAGHVIQVQYTQLDEYKEMSNIANTTQYVLQHSSSPSTSLGTAGVLQVAITPKSSSKIRIDVGCCGECDPDVVYPWAWFIVRDSTAIISSQTSGYNSGIFPSSRAHHASDADSTMDNTYFSYFYANHGGDGSTSITYKLGFRQSGAVGTFHINRTKTANNTYGMSFISATEISG